MIDLTSTLNSTVQTASDLLQTVHPSTRTANLLWDIADVVKRFTPGGEVGGVPTAALGDFADLIQLQIEVQKEMQTVTMVSNIEKSKHESKMAAIRNVRAN